ncbi:MAG: hypothetical protein HYT79_00185 [Elusimicrobia bacterium]|nr:hypothetical protein [Elusimicrobiota bacterium]
MSTSVIAANARTANSTQNALERFERTIEREFFNHPVITNNAYTRWFRQGLADEAQVIDLIEQFSVFSNHFIVIQAKRMVNAATEEGERGARFILTNELGVGLDVTTGSTEGKTFATKNAHLNWLRQIGDMLGIERRRLGRWETGRPSTHRFLNGLDETYGSHDGMTGAGASFAIENWAAFGIGSEAEPDNFWKELITGLELFNERRRINNGLPPLPLAFFQYHFEIESGHGANVWHELEETFGEPGFDAGRFLEGGRKALDSIHTFWLGLEGQRKKPAGIEKT